MGQAADFLHSRLPDAEFRNMVNRWSKSDLIALQNDDLKKLSNSAISDLKAAKNYIDMQQQPLVTAPSKPKSFLQTAVQDALKTPLDIGSGIAKGTYNLLGLVNKGFKNAIPPPQDLAVTAGLGQPDGYDKTLEQLTAGVPIMAAGEAAVPVEIVESMAKPLLGAAAKYGAEGSLFSATQGADSPKDILLGGAAGAALPLGIGLTGKLVGKGLTSIGRAAIPRILQKSIPVDRTSQAKIDAIDAIKNNYQTKLGEYQQRANIAQNTAKALDSQANSKNLFPYGYKYDDQSYKNKVNDIVSNLQKEGVTGDGQTQLNAWQDRSPSSFEDAINLRKSINRINVPYGDASHNILKRNVGALRKALIENVEKNANKLANKGIPEAKDFLSQWADANKYYQDEVAPFESLHTEKGYLKTAPRLVGAWQEDAETSPDIIKNYVAKGTKNQNKNIGHFEKLVDDKNLSSRALKAELFANNFDGNGMPKPSFLDKYESLPKETKDAIFSPSEQAVVDKSLNFLDNSEGGRTESKVKSVLGNLFAADTGGRAAEAIGRNWRTGALGGLLGRALFLKGVPEILAQPGGSGLDVAKAAPYYINPNFIQRFINKKGSEAFKTLNKEVVK